MSGINIIAVIKAILFLMIFSSCKIQKPFSLVLLPDTQNYSDSYPEIFQAQTEWISKNLKNFQYVLHQGDITNDNTEREWQNASLAIEILDGRVPIAFVAGNHDLGGPKGNAKTRDSELFNRYLAYEKYSKIKGFGGAFEQGKMDNTWHTFKAGGINWLIVCLEFGPRDKVIDWANQIIENHSGHKVIINTHAYMYSDNTRINNNKSSHRWTPQGYGIGQSVGEESTNDGEMMWDKMVSLHPNVIMVFSGHVLNSGVGTLVSEGRHGNLVYQMLANYQGAVRNSTKGGNGFLRVINIDPQKKEISVKTYSPYIDQYKTEPEQQFIFKSVKLD